MDKICDLIRLSLWNTGSVEVSREMFEEMKEHAVCALAAPVLPDLSMPEELRKEWMKLIFQQVMHYSHYHYIQSGLSLTVPYVVLKGTAAAQYYPCPEYRAMGDIDIMTRREDFEQAYQELLKDGYREVETRYREIGLVKDGLMVELHRSFASLNDIEAARYLDNLIIENINASHVLPDPVNGLVLLGHISQHLQNGLGLRQIIDWMMFVDKCLPDENWPEFQTMAQKIGLERLAVVVTRMCELYLGLPTRNWCSDAKEALCSQLMEYVLDSGDFGNKWTSDGDISENIFAYASTPKVAFRLLQKRGLANWRAAQKYRVLRPFAWIFQAFRYIVRGLDRENAMSKLKSEYKSGRQRKGMFDALGVRTTAKGNVIFKNGKYVKS